MSAHNFIDLTERKFGRLTVIRKAENRKGKTIWLCGCECGKEKEIYGTNLNRGFTKSCGCLKKETSSIINSTHGATKIKRSPEFISWTNMIQRCTNPNNTGYSDYGGRGITVCERWLHSFENFLSDMGLRPSPKHSTERIDVNGNYNPDNCKWGTPEEQARNRRFNNNKTGYRGVYLQNKKGTWQASIRVGGKNVSLGYFKDPKEASRAREEAELKYWGKSS